MNLILTGNIFKVLDSENSEILLELEDDLRRTSLNDYLLKRLQKSSMN
jgi:hypothetical protein